MSFTEHNEQIGADQLRHLRNIRIKQHNTLKYNHIAARAFNLMSDVEPLLDDDFYLVKRIKASNVSDAELNQNVRLADLFDIYIGIIGPEAYVHQIQRVKPVIDQNNFDVYSDTISICVKSLTIVHCDLAIEGVSRQDHKSINGMIHDIDFARDCGKLVVAKDTLVCVPPSELIHDGIPLI